MYLFLNEVKTLLPKAVDLAPFTSTEFTINEWGAVYIAVNGTEMKVGIL